MVRHVSRDILLEGAKVSTLGRRADFRVKGLRATSREQISTGAIKDMSLHGKPNTAKPNCRATKANGLLGFIIATAKGRSPLVGNKRQCPPFVD